VAARHCHHDRRKTLRDSGGCPGRSPHADICPATANKARADRQAQIKAAHGVQRMRQRFGNQAGCCDRCHGTSGQHARVPCDVLCPVLHASMIVTCAPARLQQMADDTTDDTRPHGRPHGVQWATHRIEKTKRAAWFLIPFRLLWQEKQYVNKMFTNCNRLARTKRFSAKPLAKPVGSSAASRLRM